MGSDAAGDQKDGACGVTGDPLADAAEDRPTPGTVGVGPQDDEIAMLGPGGVDQDLGGGFQTDACFDRVFDGSAARLDGSAGFGEGRFDLGVAFMEKPEPGRMYLGDVYEDDLRSAFAGQSADRFPQGGAGGVYVRCRCRGGGGGRQRAGWRTRRLRCGVPCRVS